MTKDKMINDKARESQAIIPVELIERKIYLIRGHKVMLDSDLAQLYGVETRVLLQSVKRNISRFPEDFMFQLTKEEYDSLRSQIVILKPGRGKHRKYLPDVFVFTKDRELALRESVLKTLASIRTPALARS